MNHAAEIIDGIVQRVIVGSPEWAAQRLGGTWLETDKTGASEVAYCGPGYGADPSFPERFAPPWVMPSPDLETGVWSSYSKGALAYHNGKLWRSTCDGNVWQPGISAWHPESDIDGVVPEWIQPTGAHDAFQIGDQRTHDNPNDAGKLWRYESTIDANTAEPGRDGTFDRWWTPMARYTQGAAT